MFLIIKWKIRPLSQKNKIKSERWDAGWTSKSTVYGWDIYLFGLLDNFSNSEFAQIMYSHSPLNFYHLTPSAHTRDFDLFDDIILPSDGQIVDPFKIHLFCWNWKLFTKNTIDKGKS